MPNHVHWGQARHPRHTRIDSVVTRDARSGRSWAGRLGQAGIEAAPRGGNDGRPSLIPSLALSGDASDFAGATRWWVAEVDPRSRPATPDAAQRLRAAEHHRRKDSRRPAPTVSQRVRRPVEEMFGWIEIVGGALRVTGPMP